MPRALALALASLVLLLAFDASARRPWRPPPPPQPRVSLTLVDARGHTLRTFNHHGSTFVLGEMGQRYGIKLTNHHNRRAEVVVSVDGRDVVNGRSSSGVRDRGYIVPAFGSTVIRGFRTSLADVAAFRFTAPGDSFAGRHGQRRRVGAIRAMVFGERAAMKRPRPRPMAKHKDRSARSSRPMPSRSSADGRAHTERRRQGGNLGTQFGERTTSHVREVTFVRQRPTRADQTLTVRYDNARGLAQRGIPVFGDRPIEPIGGGGWKRRPSSRFAVPPP
jgi:hypothetical protein